MNKMYMIRAGRGNYLFDQFEEKGIVAIGWNELGNLSLIKDKSQLKETLAYDHGYKGQATHTIAGQIYRFYKDIKVNDYAITYCSQERSYLIGVIDSAYIYDTSFEFHNIRKVKWTGRVSRNVLSTSTKNSLGSITTVFEIKDNAKNELLDKLKHSQNAIGDVSIQDTEDDGLETIKEDFESKAREFIKDKVVTLSWEEMQDLVAALLRSLGYKTKVSAKGPDRGKDIIASTDGLGLEGPSIYVQVKHQKDKIGAPDIREFLGCMRSYRKGLYVSTSGFSKEALYEVERADISLSAIDLDDLVDFIISNYDNFDSEGRALIPLRKIYWPA